MEMRKMAEFCVQCAKDLGFEPDWVGLTTLEDEAGGKFCIVLCEGCGIIQVNAKGECITNCYRHHYASPYPVFKEKKC